MTIEIGAWERPGVRVEEAGEAGWLALPDATGPVPAVLILHPSGAWDRRGLIPAQVAGTEQDVYLFDDLVTALTDAGVAVLGFDCRFITGRGKDGWEPGRVTFPGLVEDAMTMQSYLRSHPRVDGARVSMMGISLGTSVAAAAAARDGQPCRLILAAPCAVGFDDHLAWIMVGRRLEWLLASGLVSPEGKVDLSQVAAREVERSGWWDDFDLTHYDVDFEQLASELWRRHDQYKAALLTADDADAPAEYWVTRRAQPPMDQVLADVRGRVWVHVGGEDNTTAPRQSWLLARSAHPGLDVQVTVHPGLSHLFSARDAAGRLTYGPIASTALAALTLSALS